MVVADENRGDDFNGEEDMEDIDDREGQEALVADENPKVDEQVKSTIGLSNKSQLH